MYTVCWYDYGCFKWSSGFVNLGLAAAVATEPEPVALSDYCGSIGRANKRISHFYVVG
jgi:hypothetical protein